MPISGSDHKVVQESYWERLSVEIMEDIFLMCLPLEKDTPPRKSHAPYLLTRVCWSWYKVVAEFSKMWSTIVLIPCDSDPTRHPRLEVGARHLAMCIARSKGAPLELYARAEFIAHKASFEHIQRAESQLEQLVLTYPYAPPGHTLSFFPLSPWDLPNLTTLEIYGTRCAVSASDQEVLQSFLVRPLRRLVYLIPNQGDTRIFNQVHFPNMSNLEILTLRGALPISTCFFILENAPSLRQLALTVGTFDRDEPIFSGMEPFHPPAQPFTHLNLQYLALSHPDSNISTFFACVTLPSLHFLVLLSFSVQDATTESFWPHDDFIAFLQRSCCKLRSFHVHEEPITPSQLLELLRLPQLTDSLEYFGIQIFEQEIEMIDDSVFEELTLPPSALQEAKPTSSIPHSPVLCPNIERIILFLILETITPSKLVKMFDSRLPWNASSASQHKFLRHVDIVLSEEMGTRLEPLYEKGLTFTLDGLVCLCRHLQSKKNCGNVIYEKDLTMSIITTLHEHGQDTPRIEFVLLLYPDGLLEQYGALHFHIDSFFASKTPWFFIMLCTLCRINIVYKKKTHVISS